MFDVPWFTLSASLKDKHESLREVASRSAALFQAFGLIDPLLSKWFTMMEGNRLTPLRADVGMLETSMEYWANRKANKDEESFYTLCATTNGDKNKWHPDDLDLVLRAGTDEFNRITLYTALELPPNPHLVSFSIFKKMMFAIADTFNPAYCDAHPGALDQDEMMGDKRKRPIFAGWMVLLPRELACQITPPPQAIQQTREDGSLFMAATDETFDVKNPAHLAVSKAIQEAIEPINKW